MVSLRSFDLFPKVSEDLKIRRSSSGILSVIGLVVTLWLLYMELSRYFFSAKWVSSVDVDTRGVEGELAIGLDITMNGMKCGDFGLDVCDVTGELQLGIEDHVMMVPTPDGGCTLRGVVVAHKVDGEFHIAFGRIAKAAPGQHTRLTARQSHTTGHVHQFTMSELQWFNASHTINRLYFLDSDSDRSLTGAHLKHQQIGIQQPLNGYSQIVTHDLARYTYYLKLVPASYVYANGFVYDTYQVTHAVHTLPVVVSRSFRQPGVFFKYEMAPYHVVNEQKRAPFTHMVASCCSIVGGVFVVVGLLGRLVSRCVELATGASTSRSSSSTRTGGAGLH
eukprot:TRINITY_DN249_c1_g2_i1.p1 TRINITY_DN249_c1_g2~~TRINITY_DN249_c1_g2_i1.p1  ORF type:complete len:343 (-),score=100.44 TRINITY_DN249_c1_g2_i1:174-1175(-)